MTPQDFGEKIDSVGHSQTLVGLVYKLVPRHTKNSIVKVWGGSGVYSLLKCQGMGWVGG